MTEQTELWADITRGCKISTLTEKFCRLINYFSNFFSKTVTFTKFLPKMRESEFPEFPVCTLCVCITLWKLRKFTLTLFGKNFVKPTHLLNKLPKR